MWNFASKKLPKNIPKRSLEMGFCPLHGTRCSKCSNLCIHYSNCSKPLKVVVQFKETNTVPNPFIVRNCKVTSIKNIKCMQLETLLNSINITLLRLCRMLVNFGKYGSVKKSSIWVYSMQKLTPEESGWLQM